MFIVQQDDAEELFNTLRKNLWQIRRVFIGDNFHNYSVSRWFYVRDLDYWTGDMQYVDTIIQVRRYD